MDSSRDRPDAAAALVAEMDGIRRLARRLVADAEVAEDVAQETFAVALEARPREGWPLSRWLKGVARNVARGWRRREGRRLRHERAAARPEARPGDFDVASGLSARRMVLDAVAALPEDYARVVVLRWFDDLPPRAIAKRLGVPVETVRTRLKRGLERLRVDLDARHEGDRRAWCAALSGPEFLAMTVAQKSLAVAVALLLLAGLGAGGYVLFSDSESPSPAEPAPPEIGKAAGTRPSSGPGLAKAPSAADAGMGSDPAPKPGTAAPAATAWKADGGVQNGAGFTGRVVTADGKPVAGARVRLGPTDALVAYLKAERESRWSVLEAVTDEQGRFAFGGVRPADGYGLVVRASGYAASVLEGLPLRAREQAELQAIALEKGTRVVGRVVDSTGSGVAGARVGVGPRVVHRLGFVLAAIDSMPVLEAEATTDADGKWAIADVDQGSKTLVVEKGGYASVADSTLDVRRGPEQAAPTITLRAAGRIEGKALFADGRPAAGARILVTGLDADTGVGAVAAQGGEFAVDGIDGDACLVSAWLAGLAPIVALPARTGERNVVVRFPTPGAVTVRVVAAEGRGPVTEYRILAAPVGGDASADLDDMTETAIREALGPRFVRSVAGETAFDPLEPRAWRFEVTADGFAPARTGPVEVKAGPAGPTVVVELRKGGGIRGRVTGPGGAPVTGASLVLVHGGVALEPVRSAPESGFVVRIGPEDEVAPLQAVSGTDGQFAFDDPAPGKHGLTVRAPGLAPVFVGGIEVGAKPVEPLTIALVSGAALSGRVTFSGRPLPAGLRLRLDGPQGPVDAKVDGEGQYRFEHVPPGRFVLLPLLGDPVYARLPEATRAKFLAKGLAVEVDLKDGEDAVRSLAVPALPWVEGSIAGLAAGTPLSGHDVMLVPEDLGTGGASFVHRAKTDAAGKFTIRDVLPGPWRAMVQVFEGAPGPGMEGRTLEAEVSVPEGAASVPLRISAAR